MSLLSFGCSVFGLQSEEQPKYRVVIQSGDKEIREYEGYSVAKTEVKGSFREAQREGFRVLADFIFGNNVKKQTMSMTAPVVIEPQKIAMTSPVLQSPIDGGWEMAFVLPSSIPFDEIPTPVDSRVRIEKVPLRTMAVIQFSGFWSQEKNNKKADELKSWVRSQETYEVVSEPGFAGYNPPWTLPFFRRNEVFFEVSTERPGY